VFYIASLVFYIDPFLYMTHADYEIKKVIIPSNINIIYLKSKLTNPAQLSQKVGLK